MSYEAIIDDVESTAVSAGRDKASVNVVAVSKLQPIERVEKVLQKGHRIFGENRVQEAIMKWPSLFEIYGKSSVHLLGPLQSNKVRDAVRFFDVIHSLDREKLLKKIANEVQSFGMCPKLIVQVNTGEEPQKSGVLPQEIDKFLENCRKVFSLPITGLMCIPPIHELSSVHFSLLKKLADRNGIQDLSMGMSKDYQSAIRLGSTFVRIGSAIFGERP